MGSQTGQKRPRASEKCEECRRKKCKCEPEDRIWNNDKRQRCERCMKGGQECGPNLRYQFDRELTPNLAPSPTAHATTGDDTCRQMAVNGSKDLVHENHDSQTIVRGVNVVKSDTVVHKQLAPRLPHSAISVTSSPLQSLRPLAESKASPDKYRVNLSRHETDLRFIGVGPGALPLSHESLKAGTNTGLEARQNAIISRKISTIQEKFAQLTREFIRCTYLLKRRTQGLEWRSVILNASEQEDGRWFSSFIAFLNLTISSSKTKFADCFERILELVDDLHPSERELYLLRLQSISDAFEHSTRKVQQSAHQSKKGGSDRLSKLRRTALLHLVDTYEYLDDDLESFRLRQQLEIWAVEPPVENFEANVRREAILLQKLSDELSNDFKLLLDDASYNKGHNESLIRSGDSFPPLQMALLLSRDRTAQYLGSSVEGSLEEADILGRHALHIAAEMSDVGFLGYMNHNKPEILKALVMKRDIWTMSPLCVAAYTGNLDFFKALVSAGATVQEADGHGRRVNPDCDEAGHASPLHGAAASGHVETCKKLISSGASLGPSPLSGRTAREEALLNRQQGVAQLLYDAEIAQNTQAQEDTDLSHSQISSNRRRHRSTSNSSTVRLRRSGDISLVPPLRAQASPDVAQEIRPQASATERDYKQYVTPQSHVDSLASSRQASPGRTTPRPLPSSPPLSDR